MVKVNRRLKASTLIETLIAMVVLFVSFIACSAVIVNAIGATKLPEKIAAELICADYLDKTVARSEFFETETNVSNFIVRRTVYPFKSYRNLLVVEIELTNQNQKVVMNRKLLVTSNEK